MLGTADNSRRRDLQKMPPERRAEALAGQVPEFNGAAGKVSRLGGLAQTARTAAAGNGTGKPLLEAAARPDAQLFKDERQRTEAGEGTLQHHGADETSQPHPASVGVVGQRHAGDDEATGHGEDDTVNGHGFSLCQ
jgi:hypothetical protein